MRHLMGRIMIEQKRTSSAMMVAVSQIRANCNLLLMAGASPAPARRHSPENPMKPHLPLFRHPGRRGSPRLLPPHWPPPCWP
jgi:hypothetical protein